MSDYASMFPRSSRSFREANPDIFARSFRDPIPNETKTDPERVRPKGVQLLQGSPLGDLHEGAQPDDKRIAVSYRICRVRLLDPDAVDGSTKILTDLLCRSEILQDDNPEAITLTVKQERVKHFDEEQTIIEIDYP